MNRILHIIPTLDRGGAEQQLALLAMGQARAGWETHVCCLTRGGTWEAELQAAGVKVSILNKHWKLDPRAYFKLLQLITELRPEIVHTWLFAANAYGRWAALQAKVPHLLASERCVDSWKTWWHGWIDRALAQRTECITTNSCGVVDFYAARGIDREKFRVIPNGIRVLERITSSMDRPELLLELGLPTSARLILAVNRLWPQKRVKDLIWALDLLACVREDVYLLIVGDGPQRWRLERYARQVNPAGRIRFLGIRHDVPRLLAQAECLWLGSEYEGQSNAVLEAMAAGLPVVATNIAGNRDLVVPNETGYLVPVGDRAGFAACTRELMEQPALAQRLGAAGKARVVQEFSVEKMVARYLALYESLLQKQ